VRSPNPCADLFFKCFHFRSENESTAIEDSIKSRLKLRPVWSVLRH
jgi:hypothetical protein